MIGLSTTFNLDQTYQNNSPRVIYTLLSADHCVNLLWVAPIDEQTMDKQMKKLENVMQKKYNQKKSTSKLSRPYVPQTTQAAKDKTRKQQMAQRREEKMMTRLYAETFQLQMFSRARQTFTNFNKTSDRLYDFTSKLDETTATVQESLKTFPETMQNAFDVSSMAKQAMEIMTDTMVMIKEKGSSIMDNIKELFNNVKINPSFIVLTLVIFYYVSTQPLDYGLVPIILFILYILGWDKIVINKIKQILASLKCYLQDGVSDMVTIGGQMMFTILAFLGINMIPTDKFYETLIKRLDAIPKAANGTMKIWDTAGKAFETVSDHFKIMFLGYKKEDLVKEEGTAKEIVLWSDRIFHYLQVPERASLSKDEEAVREVEALFSQMYRWKHTTSVWKSLPSESQRLINSLTPSMQDLYRVICKSSVHEGGPRKSPISVLFSGSSGRGKSELLIPLSYALLKHRGVTTNFKNEIYVRNYETEYWDGYVGQKIVHFDDAFQMKDSASKPSTEFMEAVRVNNTAPAHVHCADTGDKGRFFSSEVCVYTTNIEKDFPRFIQSMVCPEACVRRLNMNAFRISTQPEFEKEITVNNVTVRRLDPTLCGWSKQREELRCNCDMQEWDPTVNRLVPGKKDPSCMAHPCKHCKLVCEKNGWDQIAFCPHHYKFQRYDMLTDLSIGNPLTFSELVTLLKSYDTNLVAKETAKLDFYEKFADNPGLFDLQMNEEKKQEHKPQMPEIITTAGVESHRSTYFDAEEFISSNSRKPEPDKTGPLNCLVPEQYLELYRVQNYINAFAEKYGHLENFCDLLATEISHVPDLYDVWRRIQEYGIVNQDTPNKSLTDMLDKNEIVYDFETRNYGQQRNISLATQLKGWCKNYAFSLITAITNYLDSNPVTILLGNFAWFISILVLVMSLKHVFKFNRNKGEIYRLQQERKKLIAEDIANLQAIYRMNKPRAEALFGACQFGSACRNAPAVLTHVDALNILSSMCIFCCPECQQMCTNEGVLDRYKQGFDAQTQIFNANLLREYFFAHEVTNQVIASSTVEVQVTPFVPRNEAAAASATPNTLTKSVVTMEASPSSANPAVKTNSVVKMEAAAASGTPNTRTTNVAKIEIEEKAKKEGGFAEQYLWKALPSLIPSFASDSTQQTLNIEKANLAAERQICHEADVSANLDENFLNLMVSGKKNVEIRLYKDKWTTVNAKDTINFSCGNESLTRVVREAVVFANLDSVLKTYGALAIPDYSNEEIRKIYLNIYPDSEKSRYVAFILEPLSEESNFFLTPQKLNCEMLHDTNGRQITNSIIRSSLYALHDETTMYGNVIFLQGTIFMMPFHFISGLKRKNLKANHMLHLSNIAGREMISFPYSALDSYVRLQRNAEQVDAVLVALDNVQTKVHIHPRITKLFVPQGELKNFSPSSRFFGMLPSYRALSNVGTGNFVPAMLTCNDVTGKYDVAKPLIIQDGTDQIQYRNMFAYYSDTQSGDCGAPLILQDPSSRYKVLGFHVAAQDGGIGISQLITQEMLQEAISNFPAKFQMWSDPYELVEEVFEPDEQVSGSVPLTAGLNAVGQTEKVNIIVGASHTKIVPSPLLDEVVPHKTLPTSLRPTKVGGDPMVKGLIKFGKRVPWINDAMIKIATSDVSNNYRINVQNVDVAPYRRVLEYREAVQGVDDDEFLAPINRKTSMGFPYVIKYNHPKGKRECFGEDEWTFDTKQAREVEEDVRQLEKDCLDGIQRGVYWTDTLKDERRPIEKVLAGKTRVFCAGPVHFTILFRMYFLGFAAWIMKNRNANEVATGTNVFSYDWDNIARKLQTRGKNGKRTNIIAGDFENFDGSLSAQILWAIFESIQEWYHDGEANAKIRRTLWAHLVHAMHLNMGTIYTTTHSQPSGCPITAILNSIYNSVVVRIVYLMAAVDEEKKLGMRPGQLANMERFNQFVACVSYGDDNLIAVMESIKEWFNQIVITEKFAKIGHVYTDERKTGEIYTVRDLSEVAFLKRHFVWNDEIQRYIAPLDLDVVLEIFQWTKKGMSRNDITIANINVTLRELSLHGKEIFNHYCQKLRWASFKHNINYNFLTYDEYFQEVLNVPAQWCLESWDSIFHTDHEHEWIVHCVSSDMQMSAGFAKELVRQRLTTAEHQQLKKKGGRLFEPVIHEPSRTIHLVTKKNYFDKPRDTAYFQCALKELNTICSLMGIKRLHMPAMQCGLDAKYTGMTVERLESMCRHHLRDVEWRIFLK